MISVSTDVCQWQQQTSLGRSPPRSQQLKGTWALWRREAAIEFREVLISQSDIKRGAVPPHVLERCGLGDYHRVRPPKRPSECGLCGSGPMANRNGGKHPVAQ